MEKQRRLTDDSLIERVERNDFRSTCISILFRFTISILVILALSAALVWSFTKGEAGTGGYIDLEERDSSINFTIYISQFANNGRMTETFRGPDGSNVESTSHKSHSFWYQNDDTQQLVQKYDAYLTIYALKDYALYANTTADGTTTSCVLDPTINYHRYIEISGLTRLSRPHGEAVRVKSKKYVYVYQGEPSLVQLPYATAQAFLVLAYADAETGAMLGYDTYFSGTAESDLFKREYWYSEMLPAEPTDTHYFNLPLPCVEAIENMNRVR